jgi:peptidoglycan/LPS O-acetylase OafA/YrhL
MGFNSDVWRNAMVSARATVSKPPDEIPGGIPISAPSSSSVAQSDPGGFAHILQLDGVRGLAISLIVFHHFLISNPASGRIFTFFIALRGSLWIGVDLFFALSGFLITGILFDTLHVRRSLRIFYARRCVRIFPLYYLALGVIAVVLALRHISWDGSVWILLTYLQNTPLWIGHAWPSGLTDITGHLWSLALEEQFYLVWPLLVFLVHDRRKLMTLALTLSAVALVIRIVLVLHHVPVEYTYKMLPCRMDGLLLGGWLALAIRGPKRLLVLQRARGLFLACCALLLAAAVHERGFDWQTSRFVNSIGYTLTAVSSTALIALTLAPRSASANLFRAPALRWLGRYSYGIYIWHMILGSAVALAMRGVVDRSFHSKALGVLLGMLFGAAFSAFLGAFSYHVFEVHFLRLKRFFPYAKS